VFVFRSDDGTVKCLEKDKVHVSALHFIPRSHLVVIGFNFGGLLIISLRTSKVYSLYYVDGTVEHFALQEPEEEPRPILYFWTLINTHRESNGAMALLLMVNFPKDEQCASVEEWSWAEPVFTPLLKWHPDG
jgi:beta-propeller of ELYS nucleoporin